MDIFQALVDLLKGVWEAVLPFYMLKPYEGGVHFRLGKLYRTIDCGFWWKLPFIDSIDSCNIAMTTLKLDAQSLTTKDGNKLVVRCAVKFRVQNVRVFLIEVEEAKDALEDMTNGIIKRLITDKTWEDCRKNTLEDEIYRDVIKESVKWGIRVLATTLTDLSLMSSHRVILDPIGHLRNE